MAPPPVRRHRSDSPPKLPAPSLILAGRALLGGRLQPVEIAIGEDGRIASIGRIRTGAPRRDVGDAVILPAATDLHVHLRDPGGSPDVENFSTGTIAAALGGTTLVGEMPNTSPPVTDPDRLAEKAARAHGRAAVDVLLHADPVGATDIGRLARAAGGFKVYLSPTSGIDRVPRPSELPPLWRRMLAYDLPISVHAEDPARFDPRAIPSDPTGWNEWRPPAAEEAAIAIVASAPTGLRLHVAHVTTARSVARVRELGWSCEVTPHHLLLSDGSGTDARFKVNPPLRSEEERRALWEVYRSGRVPVVASDHAPHALADKSLPFEQAPSGVPGAETMLPLLLSRARSGELDLGVLVATACDRPARWFGQPLGRVAVGHRANLLVVDFRSRTAISGRHLHSACGWTPFEGWEAIFPREHYRDGVRIVEEGEYVGQPTGRILRPEYAPGPDRAA